MNAGVVAEALLPHSTDPRETALCNGLCVFQQRMIICASKTDDQDQRILNPEKSQNREIDSSIRSPNVSAGAQGLSRSDRPGLMSTEHSPECAYCNVAGRQVVSSVCRGGRATDTLVVSGFVECFV